MRRVLLIFLVLTLISSCSTTRTLSSGEYRLKSNTIVIDREREMRKAGLSTTDIGQYIKQQPNSYFLLNWNPFLNVYNWSNGSDSGLNKLWKKIGVAPVVFNEDLVQSSIDNISSHLSYLGYYKAKVSADIKTKARLVEVTYHIKPGVRHTIDSIAFDVPSGEFREEFFEDIDNVQIKKGDFLSEKDLESETVRGAEYFRNLGYYSFNKNHYFFEADTLSDRNILHYRVKTYTRGDKPTADTQFYKYRINNVNISKDASIPFRESLLRKINIIRPGDLYSETLVNKEYRRFSALRVFNSINVELTPTDSASVDCNINLGSSNQMGFKADLEASTNSSGLIGISPQLNFYHKNVFHGGEWLNLGFSGNWQFMPDSDVHSTEFGASASLSLPKLIGVSLSKFKGQNIPRSEINASYNYQNRPEYRRSIAGISLGLTGQIGTDTYYQLYPLQVNLVKLYNLSNEFSQTLADNPYLWDSFEDHIDAGVGGVLYRTTNSDIVPKTSYNYSRLMFDISGNLISLFNNYLPLNEVSDKHTIFGLPYNQYVKLELSVGQTFRFGRNDGQAFALHLDIGAGKAYGNSVTIPFEKQLFAGGASSMRGWQVRSLGPGASKMSDVFVIPSQTGDLKFEFDMEYRFKMFWKLEGALFGEVGNVWNFRDIDNLSAETLAADCGLGLRVNLDFILLRVDMGFKVHDPSREEGQRWITPSGWLKNDGYAVHFGVGYPF